VNQPIRDDIHAYLGQEQPRVLPKSPAGEAIACTLSNWKALTRDLEDGDLEIDNNGAERTLRGIAVGRRNWTFYGSNNGGRTAAMLTSPIVSCKRLGIDPFAYPRDLFERISANPKSRLAELLPEQWMAARRATANF
jgi:transposase